MTLRQILRMKKPLTPSRKQLNRKLRSWPLAQQTKIISTDFPRKSLCCPAKSMETTLKSTIQIVTKFLTDS